MAKILKLDRRTIREWQLFQKAMASPKKPVDLAKQVKKAKEGEGSSCG
jgi:hypothetical protein